MPPYDDSGKQGDSSESENANGLMTWGGISVFIGLMGIESSLFALIPILIGGAMLFAGFQQKQAIQQAIASGQTPKGQMDVKSGAVWGPVDKIMSKVDDPDSFGHDIPWQGPRSRTAQR